MPADLVRAVALDVAGIEPSHVTVEPEREVLTPAVSVDVLNDDTFGDITAVQGAIQSTDCAVPQILAVSGQGGDTYTCSFDATVGTSPHVDTVTGTVSDDEGNTVQPSDSAQVSFE